MPVFDDKVRAATILHIPHAAYAIPSFSGYVVDYDRIWKEIDLLTDWCSEQIFDVPGVTTLTCPWSRVFCDVERLIDGEPMEAAGMGFFYTKCDDGSDLRLEGKRGVNRNFALDYYKAHHDSLRRLVQDKIDEYGQCHIIDCHSFSAIPHRRELGVSRPLRPDICLGTTGANTPGYVLDHWQRVFAAGTKPQNFDKEPSTKLLSVGVNTPYSGSMVPLDFVGDERVTSIMIEVNRGLWDNGRNRHETKDPVLCIRNLVRKGLAFEML